MMHINEILQAIAGCRFIVHPVYRPPPIMNFNDPKLVLSCWAQRSISVPIEPDPSRSLHWAERMCSGWQHL